MGLRITRPLLAGGRCVLLLWLLMFLPACGEAPAGEERDVLFREDFVPGETGTWLVEADEAGRTAIEGEQLTVEIRVADTIQYAALQEPTFSDLVFEADATILSGSPAGSYGLLFRVQDGGSGLYRFNITGTGFYVLERLSAGGTWTRLTDDWVESAAIRQGVGATNRLKIIAGGPNMLLFVNGEPLGQFTDAGGYARGRIALSAGTFGAPALKVAFDNVVIREP